MPTKRTRVQRFNQDFMTETHWAWLRGEPYDPDKHDWLVYDHLDIDSPAHPEPDPPRRMPFLECSILGRNLWKTYEQELVTEHVVQWPGTRPARWWRFSAPEPRQRLGGTGTPCHERLAHVESYVLGVPDLWITDSDLETYRSIDTPLNVPALDLDDPPMYEAQATYLKRHGLFLPGERKRLSAPDFAAQSVLDIVELVEEDDDDEDEGIEDEAD